MQKTFNTKKFLSQNSIWLVLIVLVIIMSIAQPSFFSVDNLQRSEERRVGKECSSRW